MSTGKLPNVLLIDDEEHSLASMRMALEDEFDCLTATSADEGWRLMEENYVEVIFCDQRMPGKTGVEFLTEVRDRWPETVRIIITGYTDTNEMIAAINAAGIYQFLTKPWHPDQLLMAARNAAHLFQLSRDHDRMALEMRYLASRAESQLEERRRALRDGLGFEKVLRAPNSPMNAVVMLARQYAGFDVPVLLTGEAGTGKTALARAMHYTSLRSDKPFHELNCAGMTDDLLEVELFGAKRGALPGLMSNRLGLFQKADRGTLFLNGVDTLSPAMQLALLRVVTEGRYQPVGGHETQATNLRLIAGSHGDMRALVAEGRFRPDLYYALSVAEIAVPPLRARPGDIAVLCQHMLFDVASAHGKPVHGLSDAALEFLENHDWPGNLKELENEITRMLILAQEKVLGPELISRHILQAPRGDNDTDRRADAVLAGPGTLKDRVEEIEMRILRETLTRLKWNKSRAAAELGLSRVGLRAKLDRYGIAQPRQCAEQEEEA
ncbi:two-component system, NtrC family, response regulator HupR/HoxA [Ruegeria intermedia]|uniref:Two-component system, NtrC family, response regulator HupR/HoxA n=1 Tax=Ruegeria intermedia TaxID=996115 RepID=A0A1M5B1Z8_9RHOB|nr:sigma-54 dependent transcriptional regulator [Ruegeria intermedia]SHF36505.1 two-component system, NtrC family, response regulator HupR/HoxA [Ruegeria intermedia]